MIKKVIFTDLDGTLLDNNYKFSGARRALEYLEELEIPLIICTSKTKAEIEVYRKKLGNNHPFISENGGGVFIPVNYFSNENKKLLTRYQTVNLGTPYKQLVAMLNKIRKKVNVRGFSDMSANEISEDTGLNLRQAKLAKKRDYDEAFKLLNKKDEEKLIRLIRKYGLDYTKGGRYYHITGGNNKGKAVKVLLGFYKKKYGKVFSMSLGDAANDYPMFKATDKGILIKEGPKEWNKKVISILKLDQKYVRDSEELYLNSIKVLKKF